MSAAASVLRAPCYASFFDVIGGTLVTFELRGGRWVAVAGQFGLVEINGATYTEVRAEVESLYLRRQPAAA